MAVYKADHKALVTATDNARAKIDEELLKIGSRNLFKISNLNSILYKKGSSTTIGSGFDTIFKCNADNDWALYPISNPTPLIEAGAIVTIAFEYRRNNPNSFGFELTTTINSHSCVHGLKKLPANNTDDWAVFTETVIANYSQELPFGGLNFWGTGEARKITIVKGEDFLGLFEDRADVKVEIELARRKAEEKAQAEMNALISDVDVEFGVSNSPSVVYMAKNQKDLKK